jgi:hypothetical protein
MKSLIIGIMVAVSALLPSKVPARRGNPVSSVSGPTVICGSRRLSLEKPGSRKPSALSVSKCRVVTSNRTSEARPMRA